MAKKDSYWFKHDATAGRGLRMRKMAHIYGHWGKGVYWDVIEILRDQSNYCFESDDSSLQMLADLIGCKDESKFLSWFRDCIRFELFLIQDGKFFSEVLCENMANWETKKANGSKEKKLNVSEIEAKPQAKPKHKIREDKIIKDNKEFSFDLFWGFYPNKVAKEKCKAKFLKLEPDEITQILATIQNWAKYKPFETYSHPNPETYLNQKRWQDVIPEVKKVYIDLTGQS